MENLTQPLLQTNFLYHKNLWRVEFKINSHLEGGYCRAHACVWDGQNGLMSNPKSNPSI